MDDPITTTDVLQTIFIGAQLLLLAVAALFGWRQLKNAEDLREAQTRPFVGIDLDSTARPWFDLVIRNLGSTMARDVRFKFEPPLQTTVKGVELNQLKMISEGISTLPPGKELRTYFDNGPTRIESDLPEVHQVTVTYKDHTGERSYTDRIDLDFGLYWNRLEIDRKTLHDLYGEVESIAEELKKWSASPGSGLLAVTPKDLDERNAELKRQLEERRNRREDEEPG